MVRNVKHVEGNLMLYPSQNTLKYAKKYLLQKEKLLIQKTKE